MPMITGVAGQTKHATERCRGLTNRLHGFGCWEVIVPQFLFCPGGSRNTLIRRWRSGIGCCEPLLRLRRLGFTAGWALLVAVRETARSLYQH